MSGERELALKQLLQLANEQGFVTPDNITECADKQNIPIQDFAWITESLANTGVIINDRKELTVENESDEDELLDDFSHLNYEEVFDEVVSMDQTLEDFINNIRKIVPPQYKEVHQLCYLVKEGNAHARSRMIKMYLRMAIKYALNRAKLFDFEISEAISYACLGLIIATDKYEPNSGERFSTYAGLWIHQVISRLLPTKRPLVYYPFQKKEGFMTIYPLLKEQGCLECNKILICKNTRKMIMDKLHCDKKEAQNLINCCVPIESLDCLWEKKEVNKATDIDFKKFTNNKSAEDIAIMNLNKLYLSEILSRLKVREKEIIEKRFGLIDSNEMTLEEIGKHYGITRERVRQIESKALAKLQTPRNKANIKSLL